MEFTFIYFSINSLHRNCICFLSHLFFLFFFHKLGWSENWKDLLLFLTAIINFQDSYPNLLYSNDSFKCTFQSVANLIRFYIFFEGKARLSLKAPCVNIYVENEGMGREDFFVFVK